MARIDISVGTIIQGAILTIDINQSTPRDFYSFRVLPTTFCGSPGIGPGNSEAAGTCEMSSFNVWESEFNHDMWTFPGRCWMLQASAAMRKSYQQSIYGKKSGHLPVESNEDWPMTLFDQGILPTDPLRLRQQHQANKKDKRTINTSTADLSNKDIDSKKTGYAKGLAMDNPLFASFHIVWNAMLILVGAWCAETVCCYGSSLSPIQSRFGLRFATRQGRPNRLWAPSPRLGMCEYVCCIRETYCYIILWYDIIVHE